MKLPRGEYCGCSVQQRWCGNICLTLSRYEPEQSYPLHIHEDPGLFLLISGQYRELRDMGAKEQAPFTVSPSDENTPHESEIGPKGALGLNISFNMEWARAQKLHFEGFCIDRPDVRANGLKLISAIAEDDAAATENYSIELADLLGSISDWKPPKSKISEVREQIEADYRQGVRVSSMAASIGLHAVYLARSFRKEFGCSITEYVRTLRLSESMRLILEGNSIGDSAASSGFYDQSQFCRAYSEVSDSSPGSLKRLRKIIRSPEHAPSRFARLGAGGHQEPSPTLNTSSG